MANTTGTLSTPRSITVTGYAVGNSTSNSTAIRAPLRPAQPWLSSRNQSLTIATPKSPVPQSLR
ncbi:hypothetical protein PAAG_04883 [Paracoccidioides lutzii Pb01]|uniref:Uncharacterized protein n=1 Tax=Paracoccidioides lutzii (strain ATCC MYA-826 / Pb01) TaxID=502779 RepID=C1H1U7_PARBA|nr:hypothetical protein PAAG_04883 [Paracoccidioides lutzii Pb01]EEH33834.2 hypothetical protein PAAG_04883 [Paracoccidioides lutzii Pb01]